MSQAWLLPAICFSGWMALSGAQSDLAEQAARAKESMLARRYADAAGIYERLVLARPQEPGFRFNLALALHSLGRYRESVQQLETIRAAGRENPKFWFLLGVGYLRLGQSEKATGPLRRAADLDPSNLDAHLELAAALLESGQFEAAWKAFLQLCREHPEKAKTWHGLALSELALSREAVEALEKIAPTSSLRYGLAALAAADSGRTDEAVRLYRLALASKPPAHWMQRELAGERPAVYKCSDSTLACQFFNENWQRVADETSGLQTPEALYWRSRAFSQLARQSMAKLAALPPSSEQHEMLARAATQAGQKTEAIAELREAVRLGSGDSRLEGKLAKALCADRKFEEADGILEKLLAANPDQPEWQFEIGDALFELGRPDDGIVHLRKAVSLAPGLLAAQAKLGEALLQIGDAAAALPHLELSEDMDRDGSIHHQLAVAYRRVGKVQLAAQALARQEELQKNPR